MKNSSNRKPIPVQYDRGGTLRYAWLRAPPLRRAKHKSKPSRFRCLTNHAPYEDGGSRIRRIAIVALARKLMVALWRFLSTGLVPEGAVLKAAA